MDADRARSGYVDFGGMAISGALTAALAVGLAKALLYHSSHGRHVGPTSAALSDGFSEIAGLCLALAVGSLAAAVWIRRGPRFASGVFAGVLAFLIGVVPYTWLTAPSNVSNSDKAGWMVFVFVPSILLIVFGAAIGAAIGRAVRGRDSTAEPTAN